MIAATANRTKLDVSSCDLSQWDEVLSHFPRHTIFHRAAWLEILIAIHDVKAQLVVVARDGRPVAAWPLLSMRKGPLRILGSPLPGWSTAYLGPLFAEGEDTKALLGALLDSRYLRASYIACKALDDEQTIDFGAHGFTGVMNFDTYMVDLTQDEETLWSNLKSECRTRVRKAQKADLEIVEEKTVDFADDYWKMCEETFANSGIEPTHNRQFIFELWERLHKNDLLVMSAQLSGKRLATLVLPFDDHTMYYWGGASYLEYRNIPSHNLLHWEAMNRAKAMGLKWYDFISTCGGPGRFKKTFGPMEIHRATHWERSSSKLIAALKNKYEQYLHKKRAVARPSAEKPAETKDSTATDSPMNSDCAEQRAPQRASAA